MLLNSSLIRLYKYLEQNKIIFVYIPLTIYWLIIFIATSIPTDKIPQLFKLQDKIEHFLAYFILAIFLTLTFHFQEKSFLIKKKVIIFSLLVLALYAAIDELHQMLIPGRLADFYDWASDFLGGIIGITFSYTIIRNGSLQLDSVK